MISKITKKRFVCCLFYFREAVTGFSTSWVFQENYEFYIFNFFCWRFDLILHICDSHCFQAGVKTEVWCKHFWMFVGKKARLIGWQLILRKIMINAWFSIFGLVTILVNFKENLQNRFLYKIFSSFHLFLLVWNGILQIN